MNEEEIIQPMEIQQSRNINDVPSNMGNMDASELVQSLLSNEHIPDHLRKKIWILFSQSVKLSFVTKDDIRWFMNNWELIRLTIIESVPKSQYTEDLENDLTMVGMEFFANLGRAKGLGRLNERELLASSTQATFSDRSMGNPSDNPSFLDKLARMFK